jgi:hypothetical protein
VAKVQVEDFKQNQTVELVQGETKKIHVKALAADNSSIATFTSEVTPEKTGVVKIDPDPVNKNEYTLTALGVKAQDSTPVKVLVNGAERPEAKFSVSVLEAVKAVTSDRGNNISIAEGNSLPIKLNVTGQQDTSLNAADLKFRVDNPALGTLLAVDRDKTTGGYTLTAHALPAGSPNPTTGQLIITPERGLGNVSGAPLSLNVSITRKFGYITFEPPPKGFLLPGGSFTTLAIVRNRDGSPNSAFGVEYTFAKPGDEKWVAIAPEGNKLTVIWNDPSPDEIESLPAAQRQRPAQVTITATARGIGQGEQIDGKVIVRMGSVSKFMPLRVKMNIMDTLTATDLYGKVMSDEYYVLTVRLFNNLKDDTTGQFTGDSILAYSSSIELAVGMEKKFDRSRGSDFANVIGKDAANRIAKARRDGAIELAEQQTQADISTAKADQAALSGAIKAEADARAAARAAIAEANRLKGEALKQLRKKDAEWSKANAAGARDKVALTQKAKTADVEYEAAYGAARTAIIDANTKIAGMREAADYADHVRASVARSAANRVTLGQSGLGDPDTAIDDGRWHPVSRADLYRISETKPPEEEPLASLPELQSSADLAPAATISESEARTRNALASPSPTPGVEEFSSDDGPPDPLCRGVITYRPFTFEMMVNTVDRRDERSRRSRLFQILEGIGTGTSFVTSIAVPGSGSDLPLGLEKFGNLLIPGIDKLYPNFKEQWRQNIVSQAMKEIEEIPFGSDVTRVIFIPKRNIRGLIRGHDTRISEVCPFYFKVQVAIITKRGTVQGGTQ